MAHSNRDVIAKRAGALTVSLKMEVTTSAVHDGLLISTGIQTPGTRGLLPSNDVRESSFLWWRGFQSAAGNPASSGVLWPQTEQPGAPMSPDYCHTAISPSTPMMRSPTTANTEYVKKSTEAFTSTNERTETLKIFGEQRPQKPVFANEAANITSIDGPWVPAPPLRGGGRFAADNRICRSSPQAIKLNLFENVRL